MKKSRKVIFVNSNLRDERISLPKCQKVLDTMEEDEDNVYMTSIHDCYAARPDDIENMCLAKFAVNYEPVTSQTDSLHDLDNNSDTESDSQHNNRNTRIKLKDGLGIMKKCSQEFILRVKNYKQNMEPEKFYHSRLLLYLPW